MKRCSSCKNDYPETFYEKYSPECLNCTGKAVKSSLPQPREESEWKDLGTLARINQRFLRMGKAHR